jgi:hypothetical protein
MERFRVAVGSAIAAALLSCGGGAGDSSARAVYAAENAPRECVEMVGADDRAACLRGDGDACARAVKGLEPDITFADSMQRTLPSLHGSRMDCLVSYTTRGCALGSAWACSTLARAWSSLGEEAASRRAALEGCDLESAEACVSASGLGRANASYPPPDDRRLLAERACDLGEYYACFALGDLALYGRPGVRDFRDRVMLARTRDPRDVARGLDYYEQGCVRIEPSFGGMCHDLRQQLAVPAMPRRGPDDWLPYLSSSADARGRGGGGICDVDPSACPKIVPLPSAPAPPPSERARIMNDHRAACAAGDGRLCLRLVELELLRFDHSIGADLRNQGEAPPADLASTTSALCARGVAGACLVLTYPSFRAWTRGGGGAAELLRACDLGAPLGCALAAHYLRPRDATTRSERQRLYARACAGGLRWTCNVSVR